MKYYVILLLSIITLNSSEQKPVKPNILLILVDDLKPNLGVYGDPIAISPNIDKLAKDGLRFDLAYANQAVCAPSRYNLLLGARSTSTGLYSFGTNFREILPNAVTLPQYFKNAGYHTESIGKVFHIGHGNLGDQLSWSIPHHEDKVIEYVLPESNNRQLTREEALFGNAKLYSDSLIEISNLPRGMAWEAPDVLDEAYADGRVAAHTIKRLRELSEDQTKPFFMAVGFVRPHLPFSVPKKYWDLYDKNSLPVPEYEGYPEGAPEFAVKRNGEIFAFKPVPENERGVFEEDLKRNLIHGYYASISYMDRQMGRVIDELQRLNLDENTIIILWGDHGWHLGDHGIWTKHTNYEQATRIPLLIKAPGVTTSNSFYSEPVETVDIYPTLADLAGLEKPNGPQPIDGETLKPVLINPSDSEPGHAYHAYKRGGYLGEAIRTKRYRMVRWTNMKTPSNVLYELYDYVQDPNETKNISNNQPEIVTRLLKILESYPKAK